MTTRRAFLSALAAVSIAAPALAQGRIPWRMVTSWPRDLPGPGVSARRLAERIRALSGGRLEVMLHAAGEVVPALGVFDAVATGTAQMAHTAAFFWAGRIPAAAFFTTVPFGLTPSEHAAWIAFGGGQTLWDELYAGFGLKPFMAGNTGPSMGGWFRRPLETPDNLRGLRIRVAGLGAEMYRALGAAPVLTAPGDIFQSLRTGVIDAAEFLGPAPDLAQGFHQAAAIYYGPGVTKPNGTGEAIVSRAAFDALTPDLRAIVEHACTAEAAAGLAEAETLNAATYEALLREHRVEVRPFPAPVATAFRDAARAAVADLVARDAAARRVHDSYGAFLGRARAWSRMGTESFLRERG